MQRAVNTNFERTCTCRVEALQMHLYEPKGRLSGMELLDVGPFVAARSTNQGLRTVLQDISSQ